MPLQTIEGTELPAKTLAKLLGELETKVYPAALRLGWRDFYEDIQSYGAQFIGVVMKDGLRALAYVVAFDDGDGLYVSDLACDTDLHGADRIEVLTALALLIRALFGDSPFTAELRATSRPIVRLFCDVLDETTLPDYFDNGEDALAVRAVAKIPSDIERVRVALTTRVRSNAKRSVKGGRPAVPAPRVAREMRVEQITYDLLDAAPKDQWEAWEAKQQERVFLREVRQHDVLDMVERAMGQPDLRHAALMRTCTWFLDPDQWRFDFRFEFFPENSGLPAGVEKYAATWRTPSARKKLRAMRPAEFQAFALWVHRGLTGHPRTFEDALASFGRVQHAVQMAVLLRVFDFVGDALYRDERLPVKLGHLLKDPRVEKIVHDLDYQWLNQGDYDDDSATYSTYSLVPPTEARPSARLAWYMAFGDAFCPSAALTIWDTQNLSYPEYRKMVDLLVDVPVEQQGAHLGPAVRLLRVFGTVKRVRQYLDAHFNRGDWRNFAHRIHDAGQFNLPASTAWKPKAWADLALKYGPEVLDYGSVFAEVEAKLGRVPSSLAVLRSMITNTSGIFVELLLKKFGYTKDAVSHMHELVAAGAPKRPLPDNLELARVGKWVLRVLAHDDMRGMILGHLTSCCQSYNNIGHACALHGSQSPLGGFVVVERSDDGVIVAQSWYWVNTHANVLVFDSIEVQRDSRYDSAFTKALDALYYAAADKLVREYKFNAVNVGTGGYYHPAGRFVAKNYAPEDYWGYRDSHQQVCLAKVNSKRR